jgi:serine kinase of HPr protein (carbohydrate metabolism regulator)
MRIHATCVVIGEAGILIRGPSGSGKSSLARALLADAALAGRFARLVGDDRVEVEALNGRLVARPVAPIEGRLEVRGLGIVGLAHEPAAVVRLVVDCAADAPARMPEAADAVEILAGIEIPRLASPGARAPDEGIAQRVQWRLHELCDAGMTHL